MRKSSHLLVPSRSELKSSHLTKLSSIAMSTQTSQDDKAVMILQEKLKGMIPSMVIFSDSLRSLYAANQVTNSSPETKGFLEVRDSARKSGIVYSQMVLPMTEEVIRGIGFFSDYFTDLDFDNWTESLEDIISDVEKAHGVCDILKQMHSNIIIDLKKNETKADISILKMAKMAEMFREQEESLRIKSIKLSQAAQNKRDDFSWADIFTFGIHHVVQVYNAGKDDDKAALSKAESIAKGQNAMIVQNAVEQTQCYLIPAIGAFINALEAVTMFLSDTREKLAKMKHFADKGARKPYYTMMKNRAKELNETCVQFLSLTDMMRNNLAAIPSEPNDKNYVDQWLDMQKKEFLQEKSTIWMRIQDTVARVANNYPMSLMHK